MISKNFVQKYLDVKEMLEKEKISAEKYTALILTLCNEYRVNPAKLAEYNMDLEPKKLDYGNL